MTNKETIQTLPDPPVWPQQPTVWWKWMHDLYVLITGKEGRQNFINVLTNTKTNNIGVRSFFLNQTNGDATFSDTSGAIDPYLGPDGQLIVPTTIIATRREIINVGAMRAYQSVPQTFFSGAAATQTYNAVSFDEDSGMSTGTGVFTPKQAGIYAVTGTAGFAAAGVVAGKYVAVGIAKNGVTVGAVKIQTSAVQDIVVTACDLVQMNGTTDNLSIAVEHNFGANADTFGAAFTNYFTAIKVD